MGLWYLWFYVQELPTGSGSGFKASQKTGQRLKVSSDRLGEARNRTCDPWFTRHRFISYTTAASYLFTFFLLYSSVFHSLFLEGCTINFLWFVTQYIFFQIGLLSSNSISVKWPIFVIDFNYVYKFCTRMTSGNELAGY